MKKILIVDVPEGFVLPFKIVVAPAEDNTRDAMRAIEWKEIHIPKEQEKEAIIERLAKESTALDADTPDWLKSDICNGFNEALKLLEG